MRRESFQRGNNLSALWVTGSGDDKKDRGEAAAY